MLASLILGVLLIAMSPAPGSASQIRPCAELADQIAQGLVKRNVTRFTLRIVRRGSEGDRRVVGSCEGSTRSIVYEPGGSGRIESDDAAARPVAPAKPAPPVPAPAPAPPPSPRPVPAPSSPKPEPPPPTVPPESTAATVNEFAISVRQVIAPLKPRFMSRDQLTRLRGLAVEHGADDRASLEEFVQYLKVSDLNDLTGGTSNAFVIVESQHTDAASSFTMVTQGGRVILAERSAWVIGLLPEKHEGLADLCLLARDHPAPGANYSDWTAQFNGSRYVKTSRQFKSASCLDRVIARLAR